MIEELSRDLEAIWLHVQKDWKDGQAALFHTNCIGVMQQILRELDHLGEQIEARGEQAIAETKRHQVFLQTCLRAIGRMLIRNSVMQAEQAKFGG